MADSVDVILRSPVVSILGATDDGAITGDFSATLAELTASAGNANVLVATTAAPQVALSGAAGATGTVGVTLVAASATVTGQDGIIGALAAIAAPLQTAFSVPSVFQASLAPATATLAGTVGVVGQFAALLPEPTLSAAGFGAVQGSLAAQAQAANAAFTGLQGAAGAPVLVLASPTAALAGHTGIVGTVQVQLPLVQVDAQGWHSIAGSVDVAIPAAYAAFKGGQAVTQSQAWALCLKGNRLTQYDNYAFNSMATFNGLYLGADGTGIFALMGEKDDGQDIDARFRPGVTDFGDARAKRVERAWVGGTTDGDLTLNVLSDGEVVASYLLADLNKDQPHNDGVKIGQGLNMRYWQVEVQNVDGSDFYIDTLELIPRITPRRFGG